MDMRVERTRKSIGEAFLALRAKKAIEKITVKELSELAYINKATFYLHYRDLYDLAEQMESEFIESCLAQLPAGSTNFRQIAEVFLSHSERFGIMFSGSRMENAIQKLEYYIKSRVFKAHPELKGDLPYNVRLSAVIYGCFYAFSKYRDQNFETVITALDDFASSLEIE